MTDFLQSAAGYTNWIQLLSLAAGIVYMVMQIFQHKLMWYFGLLTAGAALLVSLSNVDESGTWAPLWAQVMLNTYFLIMDVVGIFRWKRIKQKTGDELHIVKLPRNRVLTYALGLLVGGPVLCAVFAFTNDPEPVAEGISFALSILAQILLTRSHLEQWYMWMAADIVNIILFASQGAWFMVGLYYCYLVNSCIGVWYWRNHGKYI